MAQLPTAAQVQARLRDSFALDEQWGLTMGLPDGDTKEAALRQLADLLEKERVSYAVIGGIAVQLYTEEPRTTRDIDVALASYQDLPRIALELAGFEHEGRFDHSDNWRAPGSAPRKQRTAIQFMADQLTPGSVERAQTFELLGMRLRVAKLPDLVLLKLEAAEEPRRRPSKRRSDAADVSRLLEEHPDLEQELPGVRERLAHVDDTIRGK
jgi:predicted nucleotidyltransferase